MWGPDYHALSHEVVAFHHEVCTACTSHDHGPARGTSSHDTTSTQAQSTRTRTTGYDRTRWVRQQRRTNGDARGTQSTSYKHKQASTVQLIMLHLARARSLPSDAPGCIHGRPTVQATTPSCDHYRALAAREPLSGQVRRAAVSVSSSQPRRWPCRLLQHPAASMAFSAAVSLRPVLPASRWIPPSASPARTRERSRVLLVGPRWTARGD